MKISCISSVSYIKPQLLVSEYGKNTRCISSVSYIKPQHSHICAFPTIVVYRPFPTSNHNYFPTYAHLPQVVYRPFPTSNHNVLCVLILFAYVVYSPFPTSNHNPCTASLVILPLYIVRFLHQTTTCTLPTDFLSGCISSVSYIKPQL